MTAKLARLTPRQREIVRQYARHPHSSYKLVAFQMGLSWQTLKNHMSDGFKRSGVSSLGHLCYLQGVEDAQIIDSKHDAMRPP